MSSCAGKAGVVTGASAGLGRATTLALASDGAHVLAISRNFETLRETAALAEDLPGTVVIQRGDVSDERDVMGFVGDVENRFGTVDFVVNNAAVQIERDFSIPPTTIGTGSNVPMCAARSGSASTPSTRCCASESAAASSISHR
jgi:NAD(P)-dependent dehydrogenase (short-subunit alcohol dehydrogenase family)